MGNYAHTEAYQGFTINLELLPEDQEPDWEVDEEERLNLLKSIEEGDLLWFVAKVTAEKCGILLASEYLGGCCYDSVEEFIRDEYFNDMKEAVVIEAKAAIQRLVESC